ncbi:Crp/Fnr family transcriptional regulator [Devosia albogilva]|jgi:CRP-like cAMP-binding protein|uniref:Crp/Fnr family transcriptional regulator n=1 Tax=Devosia albogilva TaxID=429726 RepID=A0ABW5QMX9_9HYPH
MAAFDIANPATNGAPQQQLGGPIVFGRLQSLGRLPAEDIAALASAKWRRRILDPREEFDPSGHLCLVGSGWACRYRKQQSQRQLVSLVLPGDICDFGFLTGSRQRARFAAVSRTTIIQIDPDGLAGLSETHPRILASILANIAIEGAIAEELLVSLGRRTALERVAHLLCELHVRLDRLGLARNGQFEFPLTQAEVGEYLGLSTVHVNRTLQVLRHRELIRSSAGRIQILKLDELREVAGFDPSYLETTPPRETIAFDA